jgi:HSP20 family protein
MSWLVPRRGERGPRFLASLQNEVNRLFDSLWRGELDLGERLGGVWMPDLDVEETDDAIVVRADVPGVKGKDLDITVTGGVLTIKGEKREEKEERSKRQHVVERTYGSFTRSIDLPEEVDTAKVKAECKEGVLTVTLPKKPGARPRQIKVDVD